MHLHHLNNPFTAEDSCKLSFLACTECRKFQYFEYNKNYEVTTPIDRIRNYNSTVHVGGCFVGSCNGLICLADGQPERPVCIFNPFTKDYVVLPETRTGLSDEYDEYISWSFGFGYVSATNEYKVVGTYVSQSKYLEVYIYTLGSGIGWRDLGRKFNLEFSPMYHHEHEAIYWIGSEVDMIVTFDLAEEKFCELLAPPHPFAPDRNLLRQNLGVLDGFLYIAIYVDEGDGGFDVWLLKKKNDNPNKKEGDEHRSLGWSKEFRVDKKEILAVTKSGGVLTFTYWYLNIYDTKASTSKRLVDFEELVIQVFPHNNTFISLRELGKKMRKK